MGRWSQEERRLEELVRRRRGLVCWDDAANCGFTRKAFHDLRRRMRWTVNLQPRVYCAAMMPISWDTRLRAAILSAGPSAAASHATAAALMRFEGFHRNAIEITVPHGREPHLRNVLVHRSRELDDSHCWNVEGVRTTKPARTLLDLIETQPESKVVAAMDGLGRNGGISKLIALRCQIGELGVGRERAWLTKLMTERICVGIRTVSALESEVEWVLRDAGLHPIANLPIYDAEGKKIAVGDFVWPQQKVIVEGHSFRWHGGVEAFEKDEARTKRLRLAGYEVINATRDDIRAPADLIRLVTLALSKAPFMPINAGPSPREQLSLLPFPIDPDDVPHASDGDGPHWPAPGHSDFSASLAA